MWTHSHTSIYQYQGEWGQRQETSYFLSIGSLCYFYYGPASVLGTSSSWVLGGGGALRAKCPINLAWLRHTFTSLNDSQLAKGN